MPKSGDIPPCPGVPSFSVTSRDTREFEIQIITSVFGGGVEAGKPDESFPIRPTQIRGQLQFWWRATVGAKYGTAAELKKAHSEVWGSTERASEAQVRVEDVSTQIQRCAEIRWNQKARQGRGAWRIYWNAPFDRQNSSLPYALFPFQGETPPPQRNAQLKVPPASCIRGGRFRLVITCPEQLWSQLEPALWAWVNFGGLGARTRRGCGALYCKDFAPKDINDLRERWKKYMPEQPPVRQWPTLGEKLLFGKSHAEPIEAWDKVIELLKKFRQGVGIARNPGQQQNRPGRSWWPEPETIRKVTGRRCSRHQRMKDIPADAFPRAEFGLPIVFHFKDSKTGDPSDTVLYPVYSDSGRERMASPLILKPLAITKDQAIPIILPLKTPKLEGVNLKQGDHSLNLPPSTVIRGEHLARYRNSPLGRFNRDSALNAFLQFAMEQGFQEVRL